MSPSRRMPIKNEQDNRLCYDRSLGWNSAKAFAVPADRA